MIKNKLKEDSVDALKKHESRKVEVLRFLVSLIDKKEMQLPIGTIKEADEIGVLRKELKNKQESLKMFSDAGRKDLADEIEMEIEILKKYLPEDITEEQVEKAVEEIIKDKGNNFGLVMKEVMNKFGGAVDGSVVSRIVKEKIS